MSTISSTKYQASRVLHVQDPPVARALFGDVRWAWIWLLLRLYVGYEWLHAGFGKITSSAWTGSAAGTALTGFANGALSKTTGANPAVQGWYAWFLQHIVIPNVTVWSYVIAYGEFLVGVALILGLLTGIAAFFGSFMNMNYLLAGAVSTNPILFAIATFLVLAWKTAGWWGLDRWILPALGTPWRPGYMVHHEQDESSASGPSSVAHGSGAA